MIEITKIMEVIGRINSNCTTIDNLEVKLTTEYKREKRTVESSCTEMVAEMRQKYDAFKDKHFLSIKRDINELIDLLKKDYSQEWASVSVSTAEFSRNSYEENEKLLHKIIDELNTGIGKLNAVDFDKLVPPVKIEVNGETFTTFTGNHENKTTYDTSTRKREMIRDPLPIKELATEVFGHCKRALACIDALIMLYDRQFDIGSFAAFVDDSAAAWMAEFESKIRTRYVKSFDELFVDETAGAIPKSFFVELDEDGKNSDVDVVVGASGFNRSINIGDIKLLVEDEPKHLKYIQGSPVLDRYLENGYLSAPLILDLKKCGNIVLNVDEENYSDKTIDFVNQLIMQFLLSFPANRINFCLVDVDNKMEFSQFKKLTKINNDILLGGIVRDDRKLEDTIKDMEMRMYKVNDDVLSYNGVEDIYEYNDRFKANPQNVHLFVLSNFPSGMRDETARKVLKLIQAGNKAGIYTIVINNESCNLGSMFKANEYQHFMQNVSSNALVINKVGDRFTLDLDTPNYFEPKTDIRTSQLDSIIEMLKDHATQLNKVVIPLEQMFEDTDAMEKSPKGIPPTASLVEIPIGARGGELQTLALPTNGDVHAVAIGGTGSGKSNLLHTIIMSACYKYSPEELNIYLLDLKEGVEFKYYENHRLPHIKLLGVDLKEDIFSALAILKNLQNEITRRGAIFRECGVSQIDEYVAKGKKMPRILVIIDEIQELFEIDEKIGQEAVAQLATLFKQGRAFGINILWASQNVPNFPGLKTKVLSQIKNRISLRLNDPDDALSIGIDPKAVKNLNRPEKGLGVINDIRYGNDSVEFRVAYAYGVDERTTFSDKIVKKWKKVTDAVPQAPMFIVGGNEDPSPIEGETLFTRIPTENDIVYNESGMYNIQLGQDYVAGKPFNINIPIGGEKANVIVAGVDVEISRDMMGYALLSLIANRVTDSQSARENAKIYYANGEMINPRNSSDLFNVIRTDFEGLVEPVSSVERFKLCIKDLYKLYKDRVAQRNESEELTEFTPRFLVVHSIQRYASIFNENPTLSLSDEGTPNSEPSAPTPAATGSLFTAGSLFSSASAPVTPSSAPKSVSSILFNSAVKELLTEGGAYGIHFIVSIDNPLGIGAIKEDLKSSMSIKLLTKGIDSNATAHLLSGDYKAAGSLNNPKVALVAIADERTKIRVYRYDAEQDGGWYKRLCEAYKKLGG